MFKITEELFANQDIKYGDFTAKLTPGIERDTIIGVRSPILKKLVKEYVKNEESRLFLDALPHNYYEENLVHGALIAEIRDYDQCIARLEQFLPYMDNWAVTDTTSPKCFKKHKEEVIDKAKEWIKSERPYTIRFGLNILMRHFLDEDFKDEYLEYPAEIKSDEYYVNMMIAWYYATALAKQWDAAIPYIENYKLGNWVHRKTIQKAVESFRITDEQKEYLKTFRKKT